MQTGRASTPPISAYAPGSFALFTIQQRLPKILADVRAQFDARGRSDPRWSSLETALLRAAPIEREWLHAETRYWSEKLASLADKTWGDLSFFELEFLFYLALRSIARDLKPGFDVFANVRRDALAGALPAVARAAEANTAATLADALLRATLGNEADLSQLARSGNEAATSVLKDERPHILERLRTSAGTVQLLADNAGSELCFDLLLADLLLTHLTGSVELQLKPQPMFVSDALISDAEETLAAFERTGAASALGRAAARLHSALESGRLTLRAPPDWAEPRAMNALSADLAVSLRAAALVLAKGDLNARRFFEDRAWPATTAVKTASVAEGMHAYALRVLKSDCVAGLEATQVDPLFATDPNWRTNGRYAVIQRVDRGAS